MIKSTSLLDVAAQCSHGVLVTTFCESIRHLAALRWGENPISVGDEGGFAPAIATPVEALDLLVRAITDAGYKPRHDVAIALDPAANGFYRDGAYHFGGRAYNSEELTACYGQWIERYPIVSIEDGLAEDDLTGWAHLTRTLGSRVQLVGDDIFVSNADRITEGASSHLANAVLLKPNQIGTLTEITEAAEVAQAEGFRTMSSLW